MLLSKILTPPLLMLITLLIIAQAIYADEQDSLRKMLDSDAINAEEKSLICAQLAFQHQDYYPDSANYFAHEGLKLAKLAESKKAIVKNLVQLGYYYYLNDELDSSVSFFTQAESYFNDGVDSIDLVRTWNVLGDISNEQSNYFKATAYYLRALRIAEFMHDTLIIASITNNLGILYENLGEQDKGYAQYKRSAEMFEAIGATNQLGFALNNMGIIQVDQQQYDSARNLFARAMVLFIADSNHYGLANLYFNLAKINITEDSLDEARKHIDLGLEESRQLGSYQSDYLTGTSLYLLGQIMYLETDHRQAIGYLSRSLDLARKNKHLERIVDAADLLATTYEQIGKNDSAVYYLREYIAYYDSLTELKNDREIARIKYEDALMMERENFRIQKDLLTERNANRRMTLTLVFVGAIAILLLVILFLKFRMKRNALVRQNIMLSNKNLSERLVARKKEIATQLLYLEQKNNLIKTIANELKEIIPYANIKNKKMILDAIRRLEKSHFANNWSEFEVLFKNIHSDFYTRLHKKYPNLTPNEQKLCAFIYMNMSTKDIAGITFQNYESIRTARHRLRKKLNIENDQHLISFLSRM